MNNYNKSYIVRDCGQGEFLSRASNNAIANNNKWKIYDKYDIPSRLKTSSVTFDHSSKYRKVITKNTSSLPQIAIKRKDNESLGSANTEVVLLNGNWDTSHKIPNIIAEMHNVNIEELQALQTKHLDTFAKQDPAAYISPSPPGSDSGIEGDCNDGNLSWLLNYKIHELPPVPDCVPGDHQPAPPSTDHNKISSQVYIAETIPRQYFEQQNVNITRIIAENRSNIQNRDEVKTGHTYKFPGPKKPPFTYTELIEHALREKGELTVSGIYQWISEHFPFYKQNDDRWKNSVRHNLSINPHFRKGSKAVHGAGHLWTIAQKEDKKTWNIKRQRMQQFMATTYNNWNGDKQLEMEVVSATASIIPEQQDDFQAANNTITNNKNNPTNVNNGTKKQNMGGVEYVIEMSNGLGGNFYNNLDFLCPPVSKEQVVEECGLGGDYLITDLNPTSLGLNLAEAEIITSANLYDDLNFQCYELQTE